MKIKKGWVIAILIVLFYAVSALIAFMTHKK